MNDLALIEFSQEDREQFYQLIGYRLTEYEELQFISDAAVNRALKAAEKIK